MKYITKFDISKVTLSGIDDIVEQFRAYGTPSVNFEKAEITCIFEVGEGGVVEDLWDLRDVCDEIDSNIGSYVMFGAAHIAKPVPYGETQSDDAR